MDSVVPTGSGHGGSWSDCGSSQAEASSRGRRDINAIRMVAGNDAWGFMRVDRVGQVSEEVGGIATNESWKLDATALSGRSRSSG